MLSSQLLTVFLATLITTAQAKTLEPFSLPSSGWAGIDGNWSTVEFLVGSQSTKVDVVINPALSEFWVVGTGGCTEKEPLCSSSRGGIFDASGSQKWSPLGSWQLPLDYLGFTGSGQYGEDRLVSTSLIQDGAEFSMESVLTAAFNNTDYWLGQFGLGLTQGDFGNGVVAKSPFTAAVFTYGLVPSYSYGYTAGAHYRDMPSSVTLGGVDKSRFKDHDTSFTINKEDSLPHVLIRGIEIRADGGQAAPNDWTSDVAIVSNWTDSVTAIIDTATPFLYLPESVCEQFADALGIEYRADIESYILSDDDYQNFRRSDAFNLTFSLSSIDNTDDFGEPLEVPGVVNLTIPIGAFVSTVQYPFHDEAIKYGASAQPIFTLRKSNSSDFVIGRSFFQETYLRTQYDKGIFSLHQALFPDDPEKDANIVAIDQSTNSPYPAPGSDSSNGSSGSPGGLSKGIIAGIAVGACVAILLIGLGLWCICRERKRSKNQRACSAATISEAEKSSAESFKSGDSGKGTTLGKIVSRIVRRKQSRPDARPGDSSKPSEVPNHEIYEMPVPPVPVELDGDVADDAGDDGFAFGSRSQQTGTYEQQRLKLNRQLAGPVPAYSPPAHGVFLPPEKTYYGEEQNAARPEQPATRPNVEVDTVSPNGTDSNNSGSMGGSYGSMVSPVSPSGNTMHSDEHFPYSNLRNQPRSNDSLRPAAQIQASSDCQDPLSLRKPPISASNIVCLGPLPSSEPPVSRSHRAKNVPPGTKAADGIGQQNQEFDTLGSNYTEEEAHLADIAAKIAQERENGRDTTRYEEDQEQKRQQWEQEVRGQDQGMTLRSQDSRQENPAQGLRTPEAEEFEFVHVPQLASKRFSWEQD